MAKPETATNRFMRRREEGGGRVGGGDGEHGVGMRRRRGSSPPMSGEGQRPWPQCGPPVTLPGVRFPRIHQHHTYRVPRLFSFFYSPSDSFIALIPASSIRPQGDLRCPWCYVQCRSEDASINCNKDTILFFFFFL